ncbi:MAG: thioredoxin family protein, partial [Mesorhizobium sp.]
MGAIPPVCDFGWQAIDAVLPGVDGKSHSIFSHA